MLNNENQQEKITREVNEKLEEVHAILEYLNTATNGRFNYALNYTLTDAEHGLKFLQGDLLCSHTVANENLLFFEDQLKQLYDELNYIPDRIKQGALIVQCMDDNNPPEDIGDWPIKENFYTVEAVYRTATKGVYCYRLAGLTPNPPYDGYNSGRFKLVSVKENLN